MTDRLPPRMSILLQQTEIDVLLSALHHWRLDIGATSQTKPNFYTQGQRIACEMTVRRVDEMALRLKDISTTPEGT
jgi:hypothetical protein